MTRKSCLIWFLFGGLLSIWGKSPADNKNVPDKCFITKTNVFVEECFQGVITENPWKYSNVCIVFLQSQTPDQNNSLDQQWPQLVKQNESYLLYLSKRYTNHGVVLYVLSGKLCNASTFDITESKCSHNESTQTKGNCSVTCFNTGTVCQKSTYDENVCKKFQVKGKYIINMTGVNCLNCDNPVKNLSTEMKINVTADITQGGMINPTAAVEVMSKMADLASSINESAVALSVGDGVTGALVANKSPVDIDQVSFAYGSPNSNISIISSGGNLTDFSRSVSVPKEAFNKALEMNVEVTFAALMRFNNMAKDELNSTILGNEVLAVEMGASIANLTDKINISFRNMSYKKGFVPACHSWNGDGTRPNWTDDGCETLTNGTNITCQCSHLTFFAILMTPSNETISSTNLNNLTIITQVGCGLSMFFLSIVLFMHFLLRRTKATKATKILIHLVTALFLLDFAFLINNSVANLNNDIVCKIMAALMHCFMLATFTWFAVQAFHLCLQLYTGGKIETRYYMIKVSVSSWILPSVIAVILLITGKYGTQTIITDNSANNVAMCWILDPKIHYIVNVSYYALVFLFTFTTFIIIVSWLFCLKRNKDVSSQASKSGKNIVTILGLCCMLGITWGFAFFAYGPLQIPAYYIFTILNSFQGFFLFIYYYNTSHTRATQSDQSANKNSSMSSTTLQTNLDIFENPYQNTKSKK
ncbi:Adhesion G protein-coupled receptor G3 [Channa argus]|uniref:Adhesion G protein-coupled receptor G3 n=1 Tax=Channa argus TaxID=215402 RepID=A0A6G1QLH1_CHAAH|nr:Adhesion G protein-coupled receptor G3 [Channa argus]